MKTGRSMLVVLSILAFGCEAPPTEQAEPKPAVATPAAVVPEKPAATEHEKAGGCADDHGMAATDETLRKAKDPKTGAEMTLVGAALTGAEEVSVKDLVAKPDAYAGKTVRLEGDVNAMCHHRRGWFSMQDEGERAGTFVRVLTNPAFLVPAGSIGKKVRAEGKVDVIEEAPAAARHYAEGHKIGDPSKIDGPVKRVIVRATGAEFL